MTPEGVQAEAKRQGLLVKDGEATTREVLAEEGRVIGFARDGRGTCRADGERKRPPDSSERPLNNSESMNGVSGLEPHKDLVGSRLNDDSSELWTNIATLSAEQQAIARHVWNSPDRVILIRGAAGTGKTHTMKATIAGIDRPVVVLAPSAEASRGVLRKEGFAEADTVARFLIDEKFQQTAKDGVIWVDEAGLLGIRQVREVFDAADRWGPASCSRATSGSTARSNAGRRSGCSRSSPGCPWPSCGTSGASGADTRRRSTSLAKGTCWPGTTCSTSWAGSRRRRVDHNTPLVDDYLAALDAGKETVLVVAPTHVEGDEITAEIRARLKERGMIGKDEKEVETLVPLGLDGRREGRR